MFVNNLIGGESSVGLKSAAILAKAMIVFAPRDIDMLAIDIHASLQQARHGFEIIEPSSTTRGITPVIPYIDSVRRKLGQDT